jgi:glycosyltransferase involved in cell wall biosynthesis
MRILYHHRTQAEDGQAVHIRAMQRALAAEGHEVYEVALVRRAKEERRAGSAAGRGAHFGRGALAHMPRFARELAEYAYTSYARPKLVAEGRRRGIDFLYERYAFGNMAGLQAARRLHKPLVLEVNSPMVLELSRTRGLAFPRLARRVERHVLTGADRVCAVSGVLARMLEAEGVARERLFVTPNGVDLELYPERAGAREAARAALGLSPGELVLGFVGFYREWHRLELAVDALARPALERARLVLIGEGPARTAIERRAREAGVAGRVHLAEPRPHGEIPALLAAFDVALLPAINPYASPLKLIEYMAAARAIVAPDQENLRELLEHGRNALLVAPGDGQALAGALERLAEDPALRERLGRAARASVIERDLTWRGNARRVVAAVRELL